MSHTLVVPPAAGELAEQARIEQRREAMHHVLVRSTLDRAFRARLLSDPAPALAEYGIAPPEGATVRFLEPCADLTLVLPDQLDDVVELSDADLGHVAGGASSTTAVSFAAGLSVGAIITVVTLYVTYQILH